MSVINTNYLSLVAQNNLTKSQSSLSTAIERLSSGMRINSAKDDAAGQAIANRFTSNVKGLTQAARNANDGISIAQTTEGALDEINNNIQRIRELTVQAANGSNSTEDLQSIQNEIQERKEEINRIAEQTDFNGVKVLGGEEGKVDFMSVQVGARDGETIQIKLEAINLDTLNIEDFSVISGPEEVDVSDATLSNVDGAESGYTFHQVENDGPYYAVNEEGEVFAVEVEEGEGDPTYSLGDKISGATVTKDDNDDDKITGINLPTRYPGGDKLLAQIDAARDKVDGLRSHLGAIQNRFESTITNLNNTVNNLSAARSRIEDADYAVEVSNMTRAQILQQAGTSVLAQANQVPQTVLSLLA